MELMGIVESMVELLNVVYDEPYMSYLDGYFDFEFRGTMMEAERLRDDMHGTLNHMWHHFLSLMYYNIKEYEALRRQMMYECLKKETCSDVAGYILSYVQTEITDNYDGQELNDAIMYDTSDNVEFFIKKDLANDYDDQIDKHQEAMEFMLSWGHDPSADQSADEYLKYRYNM